MVVLALGQDFIVWQQCCRVIQSCRAQDYSVLDFFQAITYQNRYFPGASLRGASRSKRCSNFGHVVEKLSLNIREWDCPECSSHYDQDVNASINILAARLPVSVYGMTLIPEESKFHKAGAMKQKAPTNDVRKFCAVS